MVGAAPRAHWDPLIWDGIAQYYPWRHFASESLRAGFIPLWNPYQFCGTPFLANGQSALFYPLNVLFWLMSTARAFGWSAWLHLLLTGWFTYLLLRRIGAGRTGGLAGAVVWQANGFLISWIHLPTVLCTATWLPLVLLLCERALVSGRSRMAVAAGVALGVAYLGGHPQIFLFTALLTGAYVIARCLSPGIGLPMWGRMSRFVTTGLVVSSLGMGVAAVQLLPTLGLLRIAHRSFESGPDSYAAFLSHALPPIQLAGMVVPHAFGHPGLGTYAGRDNFAELATYAGVVALALALWAPWGCRTWHSRFLMGTLIAALLLATGTPVNIPLYQWLPGFARSGGPGRIALLAVFAISLLAGLGLDRLVRRAAAGRTAWRPLLYAALAVVGATALIWHQVGAPAIAQLRPAAGPLSKAESVRAVVLVAAALVLVILSGRSRLRSAACLGLLGLLAADPILASRHHLHITPAAWAYPEVQIPAAGEGRMVGNARDWPIDRFPSAVLPPNSATVYGLRDVFGYDSLYLAGYRDFAAMVQHGEPSPPLNGNLLLARLENVYGLDMMSLAAVDTVYSPVRVAGVEMERVGAFYSHANPYSMPRAWVARSAVFQPTHADSVVALTQLGVLPDTVLITGPDEPADDVAEGIIRTAEVCDLSPNAIEVRLTGRGGGYLFVADSVAPGWRAFAGDQEPAVRTAYVAFRAVAVPREANTVLFRYEPDDFRVGLFIALLALGCVGATGGCAAALRRG